jgi:hypothetical protein
MNRAMAGLVPAISFCRSDLVWTTRIPERSIAARRDAMVAQDAIRQGGHHEQIRSPRTRVLA